MILVIEDDVMINNLLCKVEEDGGRSSGGT